MRPRASGLGTYAAPGSQSGHAGASPASYLLAAVDHARQQAGAQTTARAATSRIAGAANHVSVNGHSPIFDSWVRRSRKRYRPQKGCDQSERDQKGHKDRDRDRRLWVHPRREEELRCLGNAEGRLSHSSSWSSALLDARKPGTRRTGDGLLRQLRRGLGRQRFVDEPVEQPDTVNSRTFAPGDSLMFKRGTTCDGIVRLLDRSGTQRGPRSRSAPTEPARCARSTALARIGAVKLLEHLVRHAAGPRGQEQQGLGECSSRPTTTRRAVGITLKNLIVHHVTAEAYVEMTRKVDRAGRVRAGMIVEPT